MIKKGLFFLIIALLPLSSKDITVLIEQIKHTPKDKKYIIMNQIKKELIRLNKNQRISVIKKLKVAMQQPTSKDNTKKRTDDKATIKTITINTSGNSGSKIEIITSKGGGVVNSTGNSGITKSITKPVDMANGVKNHIKEVVKNNININSVKNKVETHVKIPTKVPVKVPIKIDTQIKKINFKKF